MKKILLFLLITVPVIAFSQNVTIYLVDRDDFDFSDVQITVKSQKEAETDFKTLVLVYDSYRKEVIGGWGSYENMKPTNEELKKIVNDAILDMYNGKQQIRYSERHNSSATSPFDGILGLRWSMKIESAVNQLQKMGLSPWQQNGDNTIICIHRTSWEGILYDAVWLDYLTSNKQNKYLYCISFMKLFDDARSAKSTRESIANDLKLKYGEESVKEEIDDNGFKRYSVWEEIGWEVSASRIQLFINKLPDSGGYAVSLIYSGLGEASKMVIKDNDY